MNCFFHSNVGRKSSTGRRSEWPGMSSGNSGDAKVGVVTFSALVAAHLVRFASLLSDQSGHLLIVRLYAALLMVPTRTMRDHSVVLCLPVALCDGTVVLTLTILLVGV